MGFCATCGSYFEDEGWKTQCRKCFTRKQLFDDIESETKIDAMRQEIEILRAQLRKRPKEMDAERLRQLLQLCHPDKHGNSVLAQQITSWLLTLRKR